MSENDTAEALLREALGNINVEEEFDAEETRNSLAYAAVIVAAMWGLTTEHAIALAEMFIAAFDKGYGNR